LSESLLLCLWIVIGTCLRFSQLATKSPWTDEFATLVFSIGNDYESIPLNQVISPNVLLQPLQPNLNASVQDIISLLIHQDTHPPLYFVLSHLWLKLFPLTDGYVSLWGARSLAALFGVGAIVAIYILAKLAFESRTCAQLSAAMMAVSPYSIFLSQEARQYSLGVVFTIASLCCLTVAAKHLSRNSIIPTKVILLWVGINSLGLTVHYFFSLTLVAEAIALVFPIFSKLKSPSPYLSKNLIRLGIVIAGTATTGLIWIFTVIPQNYGHGMTEWIRYSPSSWLNIFDPVFQMLAAWITMLSLLPVEASSIPVVIISGAIMLLFFIWFLPLLKQGLKIQWKCNESRSSIVVSIGFLLGAIALFFGITYLWDIDITRGARYNFVYFPAVILLVSASLSSCWHRDFKLERLFNKKFSISPSQSKTIGLLYTKKREKIAVILIWLMGFISAIAVCANLGYQKYYRPDLLIPIVNSQSKVPIVIATTQQTLTQTGEMMGIAWEMQHNPLHSKTDFLLVHQSRKYSPKATSTLSKIISQRTSPFDLWAINFYAKIQLDNCSIDNRDLPAIDGYDYSIYHCFESNL
jgi:uncharacterized membrane protein